MNALQINAPMRSCKNCAHVRRFTETVRKPECWRWNVTCTDAVENAARCGPTLCAWQPRPPRRSLLRWLFDTLIRP